MSIFVTDTFDLKLLFFYILKHFTDAAYAAPYYFPCETTASVQFGNSLNSGTGNMDLQVGGERYWAFCDLTEWISLDRRGYPPPFIILHALDQAGTLLDYSAVIRKRLSVKFEELGFHPLIVKGIEKSGFTECTPVQESCIPPILAGKDVSGLAQTGTGKTAAFLLPVMDRILRSQEASSEPVKTKAKDVPVVSQEESGDSGSESKEADAPDSATSEINDPELASDTAGEGATRPLFANWKEGNFILILVPTRELAQQIHQNIGELGDSAGFKAAAVYGGASHEGQKAAIKAGVQFIVATPGRLIDLFKDHVLDLGQVRAVIFDEADRMFDMGFKDDMKYLLRRIPRDRQFLMFSATINFDVLSTAYEFGAEPLEIDISRDQPKAENVKDEIFHAGMDEKPSHLLSLLKSSNPSQTIVFSNFKRNVEKLALFLNKNGHKAAGISSLLNQAQRTRVIGQFKEENSGTSILVATDVAARGLDIKGVDLVINYELPDDPENYVHRIGRTGRAGCEGKAFSLVSEKDVESLGRIESYLGHKLNVGWIESDDIVKDFQKFPTERDLEKLGSYQKSKRPNDANRSSNRGQQKGGSREKRDYKPRSGNNERNPRRDSSQRTESSERSAQNSNGSQRDGQNRESSNSGGRSTHRDRTSSGRHRSNNAKDNEKPVNASGENSSPNDKRDENGRQQRSARSGNRPQRTNRNRTAGSNRSQEFKRRPLKKKSNSAAAPNKSASVTSKVAGFFKKLFS